MKVFPLIGTLLCAFGGMAVGGSVGSFLFVIGLVFFIEWLFG